MTACRIPALVVTLCTAAAAPAQTLSFEDYYPNRVNQTLVFDYGSAAEGTGQWSYEGTLTRSPSARETHDDTAYDTVVNTTRGLPEFYPRRWKTYHRETGDGLITGRRNDAGRIEEHLELPKRAEAGEPWAAESEFWESQTPYPVPRVDTAAGTFENCIRVDRVRNDPANEQRLTNTTTYCPGLSAVRSTVEHVFKDFRSVTELSLVEIQP